MTASFDEHNCVSLLLLFCGVSHICGMEIYTILPASHCMKYLVISYIFPLLQFFYLSCILYDSQRGDHVLLFPHFPCKTYNEYRHFDSFVFCLYPCFVSVVQIFPHKSQREGLSVRVNFCVGSLLYSRFIITIVTFYCRIGKLLCQLISVLPPSVPSDSSLLIWRQAV